MLLCLALPIAVPFVALLVVLWRRKRRASV